MSEQTPKNAGLVCFDILCYRKWHPLVFLFSELDYQHSSFSVLTLWYNTLMKQPLKNHWNLKWSCNLQHKFQKSRCNIQNHLFDNNVFRMRKKTLNWLTEMSHYVETNPQIFRLKVKYIQIEIWYCENFTISRKQGTWNRQSLQLAGEQSGTFSILLNLGASNDQKEYWNSEYLPCTGQCWSAACIHK